ncbi:DnaJ domain protein [Hokovirus HKV1]|uniref:DnaJ domain protein n=1 Tax=Hokovirus HKV1 TaxID=1977638 RepID=A0A1V0SG78_9VIRU|nr:DnaJ domain protein [Hokovirus HKV1]
MEILDYYKILGIERNASIDDINKAYRLLCKIHHPDKGGDAKIFEEINEAYLVLKNKNNKIKYDNSLNLQQSDKSLKDEFKAYIITQKTDNSFNYEMNFKNELDEVIKEDETENLLDDLRLLREQDDMENILADTLVKTCKAIDKVGSKLDTHQKYLGASIYDPNILDKEENIKFVNQFEIEDINCNSNKYSSNTLENLLKEREMELENNKVFNQVIEDSIFNF